MNHAITVVKAADVKTGGGQTEGMVRQNAIVNPVMIAHPRDSSEVHHHGEENTIIYAIKGTGTVVSNGGKTRQELSPGDWAFIPAFAEHQEVNDSDEELVWAIIRSGREPITKNLSGWGQDSAEGN